MKTWAPLWSTIVTSTLWGETKEVKILFVTMMALKDLNGVVMARADGLSRLANLTYDETVEALRVLESPDRRSEENQKFEGRRIERIEGGWQILNHGKYREMITKEGRKEYQRQWMANKRSKRKPRLRASTKTGPLPGETAYVNAEQNGATPEQLDRMVDEPL